MKIYINKLWLYRNCSLLTLLQKMLSPISLRLKRQNSNVVYKNNVWVKLSSDLTLIQGDKISTCNTYIRGSATLS